MILSVVALAGASPGSFAAPQGADEFHFRQAESYAPEIPDPVDLLGFEVGERWSEHRDVVRVVEVIAGSSERVALEHYGQTVAGRPLLLAFVSSPQNLARRESIREGLSRLADPRRLRDAEERAALIDSLPAVVWLSYNVHGNEPSPSECAMEVLYHLAAGRGAGVEELLDEVLVILDPCLNPDGRDRYVHWYHSVAGPVPDPNPNAREHREPPPGGRSNHYYFDLNRDWSFATQFETRMRRPWMVRWHPQVHVDYHEMFPESSYFFFPSAPPRNENYPRSTLKWGERFGADNAEQFDRYGWAYYTSEFFDLFYPGYGDSWPSLLGAIGMTYEQGGHSAGGLAYRRRDGSLLTLRDRVAHHFTTSLSTLETARAGRAELLADYHRFFADAMREGREGPVREIALVPGVDLATFNHLLQQLLDQGVELTEADAAFVARGVHDYRGGRRDERVLPEGTVLVAMAQPNKRMAKALLEPHASVEDVAMYDISAWSMPLAYGVEACWLEEEAAVERSEVVTPSTPGLGGPVEDGRVGWVMAWDQGSAPHALLDLFAGGLSVRMSERAFATPLDRFPAGSIFVPRVLNAGLDLADLRAVLGQVQEEHQVRIEAVDSFRSVEGVDLGSDGVVALEAPRIAVLASLRQSFGEVRCLLEQELEAPFTVIDAESAGRAELEEFNLLIVPEGVEDLDSLKETFERFGAQGGHVVAMGSAARWFTKERSGLTSATTEDADEDEDEEDEGAAPWRTAAQQSRSHHLDGINGSLFEVELDPGHRLSFGLPPRIPVLISSAAGFRAGSGGELVGRVAADRHLSGYAGQKGREELEGSFWVMEAPLGRGHAVLFSESPTFRLGFRGPMRVLLNAISVLPR